MVQKYRFLSVYSAFLLFIYSKTPYQLHRRTDSSDTKGAVVMWKEMLLASFTKSGPNI